MNATRQAALQALQECLLTSDPDFKVEADSNGVEISHVIQELSFHHSFSSGPMARRARQSSQALLKACNNKQRSIARVLDLTAGWGADGFTLASHGQQVTLLEHHPLVYACVAYSLANLASSDGGAAVARQLTIEQVNAIDYLQALPVDHGFDCIFLDPMFPTHKSSAKPAKEMQILQALTDNQDIELCFDLALQAALKRVVVKRPAKAGGLTTLKPDLSYREKSIRFDVFLTA